jgi:HSP20 family protein
MMTSWNAVSTLDRMFDDVMGSALGTAKSARGFDLAYDVRSNENEVVFVCDVPGIKKEELDITVHKRVLTISGARKFDGATKDHVVLARSYGSFKRAFALPDGIDEANLKAELTDGVLTVTIPKQAKPKPVKVQIDAK